MTGSNQIALTFDGKTLKDAKGATHDINAVLGGSLGAIEAIQMTLLINGVPATAFRKQPTTAQEKAAGDKAQAALAKAQIKPISKGSKVDRMFNMMMRKNGVTFKELQKEFGWSDGGTGSYIYYYPKDCGYAVQKQPRKGTNEQQYHLVLPQGQRGLVYR